MNLQLLIILLYFGVTIAVGVYAKRKSDSSSSFHGAGLGCNDGGVAAGDRRVRGGKCTYRCI